MFNLIVGTGALTMPLAFSDAGWLLSLIILTLLAFLRYDQRFFLTFDVRFSHYWGLDGACIAGLFPGAVSRFMFGCPS